MSLLVGELIKEIIVSKSDDDRSKNFIIADADGSIWAHDVTEAVIAYLAREHSRNHKSDFLFYHKLLKNKQVVDAYRFAAEMFQGWSFQELNAVAMQTFRAEGTGLYKDELFGVTIDRGICLNDNVVNMLRQFANFGFAVHVVSASVEPFVLAALDYYNISRIMTSVVGIRNVMDGDVLTSDLQEPVSIYEGKVDCIKQYINPNDRPALVIGDSANDEAMLRYGIRQVVVDRASAFTETARGLGWTIIQP